MKKKNNVNKKTDEKIDEYFVCMLLAASHGESKKIEIADVWNKKKDKVDIYYRTSDFNQEFNLKKAIRMPFRFYDEYRDMIEKVQAAFKKIGIDVPAVEYKCIDID